MSGSSTRKNSSLLSKIKEIKEQLRSSIVKYNTLLQDNTNLMQDQTQLKLLKNSLEEKINYKDSYKNLEIEFKILAIWLNKP